MDRIAFGKRLQSIRKEKQLTAEILANKCNLNSVFIRQIEGGSKLPSVPTLVILSNQMSVSTDFLLSDSLKHDNQTEFEALLKSLRELTPKQRDIVITMVDTLVTKLVE